MKSEHGFKGLLDYTDSFLGISDSEYDFIGLSPASLTRSRGRGSESQSLRDGIFEFYPSIQQFQVCSLQNFSIIFSHS